ncbi:MAG: bifunctional DNA-formamidopyrimidine glycosylase/DNA-(apurinic or apyrimidinic site) lyase [Nitrospira sp.]|uniref:Formamidopyrimidine-DNA glycosylase n=1 Tax=Nitrospira defluvii TaxID=330214 RepID=A0ABM8QGW3_9BACT|nr:bifunctional DNA-formamidopyrimidine glycosylase/DNA-(apurinic or apyrimidinic site) lyase [Nitrospira defluvii]MCS6326281.1 bifunctional DNA-formamidopyrimidine glycosylase/DNA-(apurinic or apyrimidinic site) lyase [Nitrospira sp.]CAE6696453.1 DNA-(apurinic or apyrimidinic site) lyase [Nitrospira defluvii]
MPELPEAEVAARQLRARVMGSTVRNCWIGRPDIVREGLASLEWYRGTKIAGVERRGKSVILAFAGATQTRFLAAELGMTGLLLFQGAHTKHPQHTHCILQLEGADEPEIRYWNPRRFGRLSFLDQTGLDRYTSRRFGYDPLTITRGQFVQMLGSTRRRLKPLLMHQQLIAGIGNIYANEILFRAGLHPDQPADRVGGTAATRLYEMMGEVLREAILMGGSSVRDYFAPDGTEGRYKQKHLVYGKAGERCPNGCEASIKRSIGERSSFYCPVCQRLKSRRRA